MIRNSAPLVAVLIAAATASAQDQTFTGTIVTNGDSVSVKTDKGNTPLTGNVAKALAGLAGKTVTLVGDPAASPFTFKGLVTSADTDLLLDPGYGSLGKRATVPTGTVVTQILGSVAVPKDDPSGLGGKTLLQVAIPVDKLKATTGDQGDFYGSDAHQFIDSSAILGAASPATFSGKIDTTGGSVRVVSDKGTVTLSGDAADALAPLAGKTVTLVGDPTQTPFTFKGIVLQSDTDLQLDPGYGSPAKRATVPAGTIATVFRTVSVPADDPSPLAGKTLLQISVPTDALKDKTGDLGEFNGSDAHEFIDSAAVVSQAKPACAPSETPGMGSKVAGVGDGH
ncbi:MAG TPA: hypothetical protein VFF73_17990 [Planctomycetota bacterium]|nr:hypothetical protein [Planctomycetota bacterium]